MPTTRSGRTARAAMPDPFLHGGQHLLLHVETLDDRLEDDVDLRQPGLVERWRDGAELLAHLARREAFAFDLFTPDLRRLPERREKRVPSNVLEADGYPLVGDQLSDAPAHDPRTEDRRAPDLAREGHDPAGVLLERGLTLEEPHEVFRRSRRHQLADDPRFEIEPLGQWHGERRVDGLERAKRRRITLGTRLGLRGLPRLCDDEAAQRRRELDGASAQRPMAFEARGSLQHEPDGLALEVGLGNHEIDQPHPLRPLRIERAAREDEVESGYEPDQPRKPLRPAEARDDPELRFGKADLDGLRIGRDPNGARERQLRAASETDSVDRARGGHR
jgi:hypothetical protein